MHNNNIFNIAVQLSVLCDVNIFLINYAVRKALLEVSTFDLERSNFKTFNHEITGSLHANVLRDAPGIKC